jgi:hypothetical protein
MFLFILLFLMILVLWFIVDYFSEPFERFIFCACFVAACPIFFTISVLFTPNAAMINYKQEETVVTIQSISEEGLFIKTKEIIAYPISDGVVADKIHLSCQDKELLDKLTKAMKNGDKVILTVNSYILTSYDQGSSSDIIVDIK